MRYVRFIEMAGWSQVIRCLLSDGKRVGHDNRASNKIRNCHVERARPAPIAVTLSERPLLPRVEGPLSNPHRVLGIGVLRLRAQIQDAPLRMTDIKKRAISTLAL